MGQFISAIVKSVEEIAEDIVSLVTDVGKTAGQLSGIINGFTPPALLANANLGDGTLNDALKKAMDGAKNAAKQLFQTTYGSDTNPNIDNGVIQHYKENGDISTVINQMKQDFKNWGIPADSELLNSMAQTIMTEVKAKAGLAGSSHGVYSITTNQQLKWTVSYGLFAIGQDNQGLIYGFAAYFDSGWGAKK